MRIKAQHRDGFTAHILTWTLETDVDSSIAHVVARWFPDGNAEFDLPFDNTPLLANLAAMDKLDSSYTVGVEDVGMAILEIEREGIPRTWNMYGREALLEEHPEVEPFFRFWRPISNAIESKLALR